MTVLEMKEEIQTIKSKMLNGELDECTAAMLTMSLMQSIIAEQEKVINRLSDVA